MTKHATGGPLGRRFSRAGVAGPDHVNKVGVQSSWLLGVFAPLVRALVFKTSGGFEQSSQWVRFPYTPVPRSGRRAEPRERPDDGLLIIGPLTRLRSPSYFSFNSTTRTLPASTVNVSAPSFTASASSGNSQSEALATGRDVRIVTARFSR
jgi:hypothetical protein